MEYLGTYRGAALYKHLDVPDDQVLTVKVHSEGMHPNSINLKIDISAAGSNWKEAEENVIKKIDDYLDEHDLEEFNFDKLNLKN